MNEVKENNYKPGFIEVKGYEVKNQFNVGLFAYKGWDWTISELKTGACIASGRTRKEATEKAFKRISSVGNVDYFINRTLDYQKKCLTY